MCDCLNDDGKLAKLHNTRIVSTIPWKEGQTSRVVIMTEKADQTKRGKPINIVANYCPFCGKKYEETR